MDRFKEALDQYVRGEWLSSISLCGDIVEFIVNDFWEAYEERIADSGLTRANKVRTNLKRLLAVDVLKNDDFERLYGVRQTRDDHVHDYIKFKFAGDYPKRLKSDAVDVLKRLSEFFIKTNMETKYAQYLDYALAQLAETRKPESAKMDLDTAIEQALKVRGKRRCPSCKQIVDLSSQYCNSCGYALG
jgi:hypothetical protein